MPYWMAGVLASLMTELNNTYVELKKNPGFIPGKLHSTYKHYVINKLPKKRKMEFSIIGKEIWMIINGWIFQD